MLKTILLTGMILISLYHPAPVPKLNTEPILITDPIALYEPVALAQASQAPLPTEQQEMALELPPEPVAPVMSSRAYSGFSGGLMGSIGYALPYGNCVDEPGVNNPGWGNPIDWPVLSQTPSIGATALWTYNHTGVVTGIWSDGSIEVRHRNYRGGQSRFSPGEFRGFR